jgi:hypothetical protein
MALDPNRIVLGAVLVAATLVSTACASMSNKEKGAVIGAAAGGAVGGVVGNNTGSTARGAIIGAVVGGTAGAIIGHQMDQQAKELKLEIPGAVVERVGEGIQVTFASGLLYDFDSDAIRTEAGTNLRNLATSLKKYANTELLIVGHTDALGSHGLQPGPVPAPRELGVRLPHGAGRQLRPDALVRQGRAGGAGIERNRGRPPDQPAYRSCHFLRGNEVTQRIHKPGARATPARHHLDRWTAGTRSPGGAHHVSICTFVLVRRRPDHQRDTVALVAERPAGHSGGPRLHRCQRRGQHDAHAGHDR